MDWNFISFGKSHRPNIKHLGSQAGELQHLVIGDAVNLSGLGADIGIGGVNTLYIGKNLAGIGLERGGQCDGRGIGAAAAQGGDVSLVVDPLETGDNHHPALIQLGHDLVRINGLDPGLGMDGIGIDLHLIAKKRNGVAPGLLHGHGKQSDGHLLAGGQQHVHLSGIGQLLHLGGQVHQTVGLTRHGRQDNHHPVALIFISEHLDVSMDSVKEIETYLGLRVVGLIPHIERRTKKLKLLPPMFAIRKVDRLGVMRSRLLFNHPKDSLFTESYINMAGRYFLKQLYMQTNTFLFSSSDFNEGKSITCCNVALACAYLDKKTLLVEADLERPSINRVFDITRNPGLTDCVIGNTPWRGIVKKVSDYTNSKVYGEKLSGFPGIKNLDLITFGQILRDNKTLFGNPKLPIIINEMKSVYDVVIFDCSPILKTDDVLSLAKHVSGVFLVYQLGRINRGNLRKARLVLEKNEIDCTGVLVNDIPINDYYRILKNSYGG